MTDAIPSDDDLMLLESHLDGELSPAEAAALSVRVASDPVLAAAMDVLRAERADRRAAFASMEPTDAAVEQFAWRVRGAMAAQPLIPASAPARLPGWARMDPWRVTRIAGAAAACVLLGVWGGRLGRPADSKVAATPAVAPPSVATAATDVAVTDEYGRLVARQHFDSPEQARQFEDDLHRAVQSTTPLPDGGLRQASDLRY